MSEEKTIEDYLSKQGGMPLKTVQQIAEDLVNHPPHYNKGKIECIDAIESAVSDLHGIEAVCTANAIKYLYRWKAKDGVESLKKARWYLDRLINTLEDK
jgi:hypothetical protein